MRVSPLRSALCAGLIFVAGSQPLAARTLRVPEEYRSIQEAMADANRKDTVWVANGVYRETVVMADHVVFTGQDVDKTILRGNRRKPVVRASNHSVIRRFTIERGGTGILAENANCIIERNVISENEKSGIQCLISLPHIRNNVIVDNKWSGVFCELVNQAGNNAIEHNVIAQNGYSGIVLSNRTAVLVQNNILYRNQRFGIFVSESSKRSRIIHNNFFENRRSYNPYAVIDATNIAKAPQFPSAALTAYSQVAGYDSPLRGLGKDGAPIGIISESTMKKFRSDSDADGIADEEDACPRAEEDTDGFEDGDGCPDYDNDYDGLYDTQDDCPNEAEDFDGFEDKDGCPDPDNDHDGIPDASDRCPNQPENRNEYKDEDGCPDQPPDQE
jgi:parallel beta-helix repeat protein